MITHGNVCDFSFYVRAFNVLENHRDYEKPAEGLSLQQAMREFEKRCADNPAYINTVLGVDFTTGRRDLEPAGVGSADLLQCIDGKLNLSQDYKLSRVLMWESLISVNAVDILKREQNRLQLQSDRATAKCAETINNNISELDSPDNRLRFMGEMAEQFGEERCKAVLANALKNQALPEDKSELKDYLDGYLNGEYDKRIGVFANNEQLTDLAGALRQYELSEVEGKLVRTGLVNGDNRQDIRDKAAAVAGEIERHNDLEDSGAVADDQLEL